MLPRPPTDTMNERKFRMTELNEYLEVLADEFGVDIQTVRMLAQLLGPNELYDGLVTTLEDMC